MNRVSTVGNYSAILANLMAAQRKQVEAGEQVSTQKNGSDLKDYARNAEMLTAMRSVNARAGGYLEQNALIADRLTTQDTALSQVSDAIKATREAIAEALASGRADTLVEDVDAQLRNAVEGMNARYGGKYLFSGGQINTKPAVATGLAALTAPGSVIADFFKNDNFDVRSKVDESTTVDIGIKASDIGTNLLTAYKAFQTFEEGGTGSFGGVLTDAQRTFLEGQLASWDAATTEVTNITGRNGLVQKRVEAVRQDLVSRQNIVGGMIGDITDVDMAAAISRMQAAQLAVQSAAEVFRTLQESSLINLLR
ncbi:MAG: flagellin [Phenylobacterium sp.]|uniref:flagellin n=1 Tax=Phenylobacterium sp. TaxID=1871053 RepID=UPI00273516BC|nr:flagellin [Phenylobacterium sp.]MDP3175563.1 flagellin [Phenylobacterium sp.]